jgi:hypothetical protein
MTIVTLSYSEPPEGFTKWSLRLLADKAVELDYVEDISRNSTPYFKKTKSKASKGKDG